MGCEILGPLSRPDTSKSCQAWFTTVAGEDREVDGPGPHMIDGEHVYARSRTFIRATLSDNPDLAQTNYASVLAKSPGRITPGLSRWRFLSRHSRCRFSGDTYGMGFSG